ncbi:MAG TPA: DUF6401 family natural product biosynthesis protein [Trebonia sp.]|jgi:hypothetical protein|nr:DUF6401 family natural product biosynthesis protein [Trebonia sp.]
MPYSEWLCSDLSGMVLRLAGEAGQVSLARSADTARARASVDQHVCEIRDALTRQGGKLTPAALLSYAQGFMEAAIARGWWPPHRRARARNASVFDDGFFDDVLLGDSLIGDSLIGDGLIGGSLIGNSLVGDYDGSFGERDTLHGEHDSLLDWESLRLAAVCRMLIEAQGLGI